MACVWTMGWTTSVHLPNGGRISVVMHEMWKTKYLPYFGRRTLVSYLTNGLEQESSTARKDSVSVAVGNGSKTNLLKWNGRKFATTQYINQIPNLQLSLNSKTWLQTKHQLFYDGLSKNSFLWQCYEKGDNSLLRNSPSTFWSSTQVRYISSHIICGCLCVKSSRKYLQTVENLFSTSSQLCKKISKKSYEFPELKESDITEAYMRGSGRGGQSVAKTNNCVLLTHKPTKLQVKVHDTRSLERNRKIARLKMIEMLDFHYNGENCFKKQQERERAKKNIRREKKASARREHMKSYRDRLKYKDILEEIKSHLPTDSESGKTCSENDNINSESDSESDNINSESDNINSESDKSYSENDKL